MLNHRFGRGSLALAALLSGALGTATAADAPKKEAPNTFTADEQTPESLANPTPAFPRQTPAP
jgi:hypothetical protein